MRIVRPRPLRTAPPEHHREMALDLLNSVDAEHRPLTELERTIHDALTLDGATRNERAQKNCEAVEQIVSAAAAEKRPVTAREASWITAIGEAHDDCWGRSTGLGAVRSPLQFEQYVKESGKQAVQEHRRMSMSTGHRILGYTPSGEPVHVLSHDEPLTSIFGGADTSPGKILAGAVTGKWPDAGLEQAAMQGGSDTSGGLLLSSPIASRLVDLARNAAVCFRAGAQTVPMESSELHIVRISGDPTSYWRHEGTPVAASEFSFDRVTLTARTLACIIPLTLELLEDSTNFANALETALAASLAVELDRAILRGVGAIGEPLGILNTSGINTIGSVGGPNYGDIIDAIEYAEVANADVSNLSWILNPKQRTTYRKLLDGNGQFLAAPADVATIPQYVTNQITNGTMLVGDMKKVVVGMRTDNVRVEILREGSLGSDNALSQLKVFIRCFLRADVAVLRENHFVSLTGVTT